MSGWVLAIDFGTSFTSVAMAEAGRVELVEVDNVRAMPSGVWLDGAGSLVVGTAAERQARLAPERWERSPKRLLGEVAPLLLGGESPVSVVEAVAAVLKHAAQEAFRRQGGPPDEVRLTHPARWGDRRRGALQAAAQMAGLGPPVVTRPPRLVPEPVAAALYFADRGALPAGAQVAVYDLGGGTFDSTVLAADSAGYTVRALGGIDNLGGETFDGLLYAHVGTELARRDASVWTALQTPPDARWRRAGGDLFREVQRAKEDLSRYPSVTLDTTSLIGQPMQLTRGELESVLRPRVDATARELLETIGRAGLRPGDLAGVYLAGGSSRMPLVERVVSDMLGVTAKVLGEPKSVVAIGAAKWSMQVRVDVRPQPAPSSVRPEANPIMPTVPAQRPTQILPVPPQPYRPPWQPPSVGPPPQRKSRRGLLIGIAAIVVVGIVAAGLLTWLVVTSSAPSAPSGLRATETEDAVNLDWDPVAGADHYAVYRDGSVVAGEVSPTTYVDRPGNAQRHTYQVSAVDARGDESRRSKSLAASIGAQPNPSPSGGPSSPPPGSALTQAQQALVDRLPISVVDADSCQPFTVFEDATYIDAAVKCAPASRDPSAPGTSPDAVYSVHYRSASLYDSDMLGIAASQHLPHTSCARASTPPAQDNWSYTAAPNDTIGERFCFTSSLHKSVLQWSYADDLLWLRAVAPDDSHRDLMTWWLSVDLGLR